MSRHLQTIRLEFQPHDYRSPFELDPRILDRRPLGLGLSRFRVRAQCSNAAEPPWFETSSTKDGWRWAQRNWSSPEPWGIWGVGEGHTLDIPVPDGAKSYLQIEADVRAALVGERQSLEVDVLVGNAPICTWNFSSRGMNRGVRSIRINQQDIDYFAPAQAGGDASTTPQGNFRVIVVDFFPNDCRPLCEVEGTSSDIRRLGMGLCRFRVDSCGAPVLERPWIHLSSGGTGFRLAKGWSHPESWGRWGIGERHTIQIPVKVADESDLVIEADVQAPLCNNRQELAVWVAVGGEPQLVWNFSLKLVNMAVRYVRVPHRDLDRLSISAANGPRQFKPELWCSPIARAVTADQIRSIVVVKVDHVGDFVLALEAFLLLRREFPAAAIDLVCGPWNENLARTSGLFRSVWTLEYLSERADAASHPQKRVTDAIPESLRWDVAIDLRTDPDTRVLLDNLEATYKFGFESTTQTHQLTVSFPAPKMDAFDNATIHQEYLMVSLVNLVALFFKDRQASGQLLRNHLAERSSMSEIDRNGRRLVIVNTSSGRAVKNWPIERFIQVIDWLRAEMNARVLLLGSHDQERDARDIFEALGPEQITSLVGKTSLREAIGIIMTADAFFGNDSGLTHMAAKVGIPTVAIYSGVDCTAVWAPIGPHVTVIRLPVPCSPCHILHLEQCRFDRACTALIDVGSAKDALRRALTGGSFADGIVIAPSPDAPTDDDFKYYPIHGGPADNDVTDWTQNRANDLLHAVNKGVSTEWINVDLYTGANDVEVDDTGKICLPGVNTTARGLNIVKNLTKRLYHEVKKVAKAFPHTERHK